MTSGVKPPEALRARLMAVAARQRPTRPGTWRRRLGLCGLLSGVWLVLMVWSKGIRPDWEDLPISAPVLTLGSLLAVAVLATAAGLARGRAMVGAATGSLSAAAWGLLILLHVLVLVVAPRGASTVILSGLGATLTRAFACDLFTMVVALPMIALGLLLPRGLTLARPLLAGTSLGLGAATFAHAVVWLQCPVGGRAHALIGHLAPAVPLMVVGACAMWWLDRRGRTPTRAG